MLEPRDVEAEGGGVGGTKVKGFMSFLYDKEQRGANIGSVLTAARRPEPTAEGTPASVPNGTFAAKRDRCVIMMISASRCAATEPSPFILPP